MRRSATLLLIALPALFAAKCKDKQPPDDVDEVDDEEEIDPEIEVKLIEVVPAIQEPDVFTPSTFYGSGFEEGATITVGSRQPIDADFRDSNTLRMQVPPLPVGMYDVTVQNPDGERATLREGIEIKAKVDGDPLAGLACDQLVISFGFDKHTLDDAARATLDKHLPCFTEQSGLVKVAGHADERGTTEYNQALGQRRAEAIRQYLTAQNVLPSRIKAVSYGEEVPLDPSHDEAAWQKNRRGEIDVAQ